MGYHDKMLAEFPPEKIKLVYIYRTQSRQYFCFRMNVIDDRWEYKGIVETFCETIGDHFCLDFALRKTTWDGGFNWTKFVLLRGIQIDKEVSVEDREALILSNDDVIEFGRLVLLYVSEYFYRVIIDNVKEEIHLIRDEKIDYKTKMFSSRDAYERTSYQLIDRPPEEKKKKKKTK